MTKIKDQVVWLTGGSSGIGEALAYELSKEGAKLILSARRKDQLERVRDNCADPSNVQILPLDLSESSQLAEKAKKATSIHNQVDILINAGGISQRDLGINTSLEVDRWIMEVNYFGSIALTKALLPEMIKRKSGHHVVISSVSGIISPPFRTAYAASKHALHGFYESLRSENHQNNIEVTIVCPGYTNTNISFNSLKGDGTPQNAQDDAQAKGISPTFCAQRIVKAIKKNEEEVYIAQTRELTGIYLKRFFPSFFSKIMRNVKELKGSYANH